MSVSHISVCKTLFLRLLHSWGTSPGVHSARLCPPPRPLPPCPCLAAVLHSCCFASGGAAFCPVQALAPVQEVPRAGFAAAGQWCCLGPSLMLRDGDSHMGLSAAPQAGQEATGGLRPPSSTGCLPCSKSSLFCYQLWHTVALALAVPRPGLKLSEFEDSSDTHSPRWCLPGSKALPSLTPPHMHPWAGGWRQGGFLLSQSQEAAKACIHTLQAKSSSLLSPPFRHQFLSRAGPDLSFHLCHI